MKCFLPILVLVLSLSAHAQSISDILKSLQQQDQQKNTSKVMILPKADLRQSEADFLKNAYEATFLLYRQDAGGNMSASCTATAIIAGQGGYALLTAAHCMSDDYIYFVTRDEVNPKVFYQVDAEMCGKKGSGLDFCFLHVTTTDKFVVVPLGVNPGGIGGQAVASIESPLGLGKQVFRGSVASPHVKRPILLKDKNGIEGDWYNYILLQLPGVNPASSGSALLCMGQRAICGVVVGVMATPMGSEQVAQPIDIVVNALEANHIAYRAKSRVKAKK